MGAVDAVGGSGFGRPSVDRAGVRSTGTPLEEESHARALADALRSGSPTVGLETHSQLELPELGTGSAGQPVDVFFYSGNGNNAGCLSWVGECWAPPELVFERWRNMSDMKVLIIGAPNVLQMTVVNGFAAGGSGAKWGTLLKNKGLGGPLTAILGYQDAAPNIKDVGRDIATKMGEKIAAGLKDDEWAQTWLKLNGDNPGNDTWSAVAMDSQGYWWIEGRSAWSRSYDTIPFISGDKYRIKGPAVMV